VAHFASAIAISPDGTHVYVAGAHDNAVAAFRRNALTGPLRLRRDAENGVNGVSGDRVRGAVTLSPDGAFVYVGGRERQRHRGLPRNPCGHADVVSSVQDDTDGVDGLRTVSRSRSADGAHLYASGSKTTGSPRSRRDANTGALTFIEVVKETAEPRISSASSPRSVAVSPMAPTSMPRVQATMRSPSSAVTAPTGTLESSTSRAQDVDGVDGLLGALWSRSARMAVACT